MNPDGSLAGTGDFERREADRRASNNDGGGLGKMSNPKDVLSDTRIPLWLLSTVAKIDWALAQFAGMLKYGAWNWRVAGIRASVYISALERHVEGIKNGEEFDPVDGTRHTGNIMACAAIMRDAQAAGKFIDDRPPIVNHRPAIAEGEALMAALREKYKDRTPRHFTIADTEKK
jgi:hypothetical protein